MSNKERKLMRIMLWLILSVLSSAGNASSTMNAYKPPDGDSSVEYLRIAFGNIVGMVAAGSSPAASAGGGALTVMGAGFGVFNGAILMLSMLFVGYTSIRSIVDSAHDGELLGKKMSSIWIPLRTAAGSALLLPLSSGYSFVQILILWVVVSGAGLADNVWSAMINNLAETNVIGTPRISDARPLALNILKFETCAAAMNKQYADSGRSTRIQIMQSQSKITSEPIFTSERSLSLATPIAAGMAAGNSITTTMSWSANDNSYLNPNVCGSISWVSAENGNGSTSSIAASIFSAQNSAVNAMIAALQPVASHIVAGEKPDASVIEMAVDSYENSIYQAAAQAASQSHNATKNSFLEMAKNGGWIYAGTYYNQIVQLNDSISSIVSALPSSTTTDIEKSETSDVLTNYKDAMATFDVLAKTAMDSPQQDYNKEFDNAVKVPTSWSDFKALLSLPAIGAIHHMTALMGGGDTSHISQMKAIGDTISGAAWIMAGSLFTITGVAHSNLAELTAGNIFDVGAALASISGICTSVIIILISAGWFLAFYVPLIPYIQWIVGLIKWFVLVLEAMVAGPIWAAGHVHPDGGDVTGQAAPGYLIILACFLRPTLMIFGLIASIVIAQPIVELVNSTYMTAVIGATHDSFNGIGAFVAYSVIYALIMTLVMHHVFNLINYLPDNVLRWIGNSVGVGSIGDQAPGEVSGAYTSSVRQAAMGGSSGAHPAPFGSGKDSAGATDVAGPTDGDLLGR